MASSSPPSTPTPSIAYPGPPQPPASGSPPPGAPPLPPPPTVSSGISYFFGFIIAFVVLLLLFVGCGIGSWRRFRMLGSTTWDGQVHDDGRIGRRKRRRFVRLIFLEAWTQPAAGASTYLDVTPVAKGKWAYVQPISASFQWSRSKLKMCKARASVSAAAGSTPAAPSTSSTAQTDPDARGLGARLRSSIAARSICDRSTTPPRPGKPPPEAIQVAVLIAMPCRPSASGAEADTASDTDSPCYVGHTKVGEYQIGVVRIPWLSVDGAKP